MKVEFNGIILASLIFLFSCGQDNSKETYSMQCAGCHGANLEGTTSASSLQKSEWENAGRNKIIKESISHSIRLGVPSTNMVAWENVLSAKEIRGLVYYIISSQKSLKTEAYGDLPDSIMTQHYVLDIESLVSEGLTTPWGIEFADESRALISEKSGNLRWLINDRLDPQLIKGLPKTHLKSSTGGFMDIALDPEYLSNGWVYLAYSYTNGEVNDEDALSLTKVVRGKINDYQWVEQQTLFEVADSLMVVKGNRWGCRFLFEDDYLYFSIGDMGKDMDSQNPAKATGKIFRIHKDGVIPKDNPFVNIDKALPAIYTVGNRNMQGIAKHPETGQIWITEHGPRGGDELNILRSGANYGWPVITYGIDYSGKIVSEKTHEVGMQQPVLIWTPSIAVCPAEFSSSHLFPKWKNNLFVGALAFQELRRITIEEERVIHQEIILKGNGRVRDLKFGLDGALYILTNDPDRVIRIKPIGSNVNEI